jgi:hypothetical protein
MTSPLAAAPGELVELTPLVRRVASLDPATLVRLRLAESSVAALVRLPFGVLAGRAVRVSPGAGDAASGAGDAVSRAAFDIAVRSDDLLAWLDGTGQAPLTHDTEWRGGLPPDAGWRRVESVPARVVRDLVRAGALAVREAALREGAPGSHARAGVADALLDAAVITASNEGVMVTVSLRLLSALNRMGFLPHDSRQALESDLALKSHTVESSTTSESYITIDVAGRWLRAAAEFGSVYAERPGFGLGVLGRS